MKAVVRRGARLVVDDAPDPVPAFGTALVRTLAGGICGSDLHALQHLDRMVARLAAAHRFAWIPRATS